MKVIAHKRKSGWDYLKFTIRGITREQLSLILSFAQDAIEAKGEGAAPYADTLELVKQIDAWINNEDGVVRMTPLELK